MKNKYTNELAVCGIEAVKALAKNNWEKIRRFYYAEERKYDFSDLCKNLAAKHIPYNMVDGADLEKLSGTIHHQGVVAMIEQPRLTPLTTDITDEWLHKKESALLLDRVGNANNLGAIVRSAAFFGFKNIVMAPKPDRRMGFVTAEYKSAAGLVKSAWRYEGDDWIWDFTIPEGATADVAVPGEKVSHRYQSGTYTIKKGTRK